MWKWEIRLKYKERRGIEGLQSKVKHTEMQEGGNFIHVHGQTNVCIAVNIGI